MLRTSAAGTGGKRTEQKSPGAAAPGAGAGRPRVRRTRKSEPLKTRGRRQREARNAGAETVTGGRCVRGGVHDGQQGALWVGSVQHDRQAALRVVIITPDLFSMDCQEPII